MTERKILSFYSAYSTRISFSQRNLFSFLSKIGLFVSTFENQTGYTHFQTHSRLQIFLRKEMAKSGRPVYFVGGLQILKPMKNSFFDSVDQPDIFRRQERMNICLMRLMNERRLDICIFEHNFLMSCFSKSYPYLQFKYNLHNIGKQIFFYIFILVAPSISTSKRKCLLYKIQQNFVHSNKDQVMCLQRISNIPHK